MLRWYYNPVINKYEVLNFGEYLLHPNTYKLVDLGQCNNTNNIDEAKQLHRKLIMTPEEEKLHRILKERLFIDVFCPKELKNFVLPTRIKKRFENGISTNVICSGAPGEGKSSLLKMLTKDMATLYINTSEEGSIDVLRGKVDTFCSQVQIREDGSKHPLKFVIFDEIDGASDKFFDALKGFMDVYSKTTRFGATTNYYNKIKSPIKSRFEHIDFDYQNQEERDQVFAGYKTRILSIAKKVGLTFSDEAFDRLIKHNFPDFRGALQDLERFYHSGTTQIGLTEFNDKTYEYKDLFELILTGGKPEDIYKKVMGKYSAVASDVLDSLHKHFPIYIEENHNPLSRAIPYCIHTIWEHQNSLPNVVDPAIAVESCVYKLSGLIANARK